MNKKKYTNNDKDNNDIEIVTGNGKNLDISHVYDHIKIDQYNKKNKEKIVVPKAKNKQNEKNK